MNKIYNNLSVDNLMKTEWFTQFNKEQQKGIIKGLKKGLNISWYATPNFSCKQMEQIREGLEDNFDVSIYANSEMDWKKMLETRLLQTIT